MKQIDIEKRLLELLKEELETFEQMKKHAVEQTKHLAADEMDDFFKSLDLADKLKEKINGLHQETQPLMQSYVASKATAGKENLKAIDALGEAIQKVVKECVDLNKKIMKSASTKKEEYTERIKELDTSKKTFSAYTVNIPNNPEHFDKAT